MIAGVDRAAAELADTLVGRAAGRAAATRPVDPFADPTTSFEALLSGAAGVTQR
jgi:FMN reductase